MHFSAQQFLKVTKAKQLQAGGGSEACGISTDTRERLKGNLFFALAGPHFDGHNFCAAAIKQGAWGVVVKNPPNPPLSKGGFWIFQVPDVLTALGDLTQWWRRQFSIPVVAITGSNGKTTTKEMTAAIFAPRLKVLKTEGNFNNLIGVPLTLRNLEKRHQAAILELGMNAPGEITRLTKITAPSIGLVTNVAPAHLEQLHTIEAVAKSKGELYAFMPKESVAIYNAEDPLLKREVQRFKGRKISFGMDGKCDVHFVQMETTSWENIALKISVQGKIFQTNLKTAGIHNVMNAMSACAVALALDFPTSAMAEGLANFTPPKMRFEQIQLGNGVRLVNDAYNANPVSMESAFRSVARAKRDGRFVAVLGEMRELGQETKTLHHEVGKKAVENGVALLFLIGKFSKEMAEGAKQAGLASSHIKMFSKKEEVVELLEKVLKAGDVVLVKASRSIGLETVVEELKERYGI